mmetsp:Transcript_29668/g.62931  ORF Transcript_29668/g.62931 Transcript_29668/m.62931 type:complete len:121 (-) Transcript_29668:134-496(-)
MPRNFEPTYPQYEDDEGGGECEEGYKRNWYQGLDLGGGKASKLALLSFVAAIPIVALFYIDHLFSCILAQKAELGLKKGEYYHSSLFVTGIFNLVLLSFGSKFQCFTRLAQMECLGEILQ